MIVKDGIARRQLELFREAAKEGTQGTSPWLELDVGALIPYSKRAGILARRPIPLGRLGDKVVVRAVPAREAQQEREFDVRLHVGARLQRELFRIEHGLLEAAVLRQDAVEHGLAQVLLFVSQE